MLQPLSKHGKPLHIEGRKVFLRPPELADWQEWAALRAQSRAFLTPWEPTWPSDDLTRAAFRRRLRRYAKDIREDLAYPFFLFRREDGRLVGGLTLSNVRRGVTQSCSVGYWTGQPYAGQGYMSDALAEVINFAFDALNLHRVEAACLPSNERSRSVLLGAGFKEEGFARAYLRINGAWRDHALFALLESDRRPAV